jgi:hypothetical protein
MASGLFNAASGQSREFGLKLLERGKFDGEQRLLTVCRLFHQAGIHQHPEMLGDGRLRKIQPSHDLPATTAPFQEKMLQNFEAARVTEGRKALGNIAHGR